MNGEGELLIINDADCAPALPILPLFGLNEAALAPMANLNWAVIQKDYTPPDLPRDPSNFRNDREKSKLRKRSAIFEAEQARRDAFFGGEYDSLIVASQYDPCSIIDELGPYLGGSAQIVVFSHVLQPLATLSEHLRKSPHYLSSTITESTLRRYQVLPGRTHPEMNGTPHGGYILSTIKVLVKEGEGFRKRKRR